MNRIILGFFLILSGIGFNQAFAAGSKTTTQKATATLASNCSLTTNNMLFGTLTPATTGYITSTATLNVICSRSTTYQVAISFHADGTVNSNSNYNGLGTTWAYNGINPSLMESHSRIVTGVTYGDQLLYDIFREPGFTSAFGDQQTVSGTGTGALQTINMYGRMSNKQ